MALLRDHSVFHIHITTTGFHGLYINDKYHKLVEIIAIDQKTGDEFTTFVYPNRIEEDRIHPLSANLLKINSFSYIRDTLKGLTRSRAIKQLVSFIREHSCHEKIILISHIGKYARDCLHELPEEYIWIDSRAAFKKYFPEMEQFRWELISINKDLQQLQDQTMASMGKTSILHMQEIDSDCTPHTIRNILRYFNRDKPSYAFKQTQGINIQFVRDYRQVITDNLLCYLTTLDFLPSVGKNTDRLLKRIADIKGINKKQVQILADAINADYIKAAAMEMKHAINPNVLTVGDLVLYATYVEKNSQMSVPSPHTDEWKTILFMVEYILKTMLFVNLDETMLSVLEYVSGADIPTLIRNGYPFTGSTSIAFYPFRFTPKMITVLEEGFGIRSITELKSEYTFHSQDDDEKRRFMNRIRVNFYSVEQPELIDAIWNASRAEEVFEAF